MENQRTNEFDGQLRQDKKVGFAKIEVAAPKQISIMLPCGTAIKPDTPDVGFLAE